MQVAYKPICTLLWIVLTLNVLTIAVLPHVTVGAARCVALRPSADAVLCYPVVLSHTLQCMYFAHIQKDWLSTHSSSGTHLQRWTGDKNHGQTTAATTRKFKSHDQLMISRVKIGYLHSKGILQTHFPLENFSHGLHCTRGETRCFGVLTVDYIEIISLQC